jgi:hypothetical protein
MSLTENLFTTASFRSEFASIALPDASLSDTDIKVLIKYLERDKQALVVDKGVCVEYFHILATVLTLDPQVIKFVEGEALTGEVTEIDRGVVEMKSTIEKLNSQVDEIQRQIEECVLPGRYLFVRSKDLIASLFVLAQADDKDQAIHSFKAERTCDILSPLAQAARRAFIKATELARDHPIHTAEDRLGSYGYRRWSFFPSRLIPLHLTVHYFTRS